MEERLPDFTWLFRPIQLYLVKGPKATPEERAEAVRAYNTIIAVMYGPEELKIRCTDGPPKFITI